MATNGIRTWIAIAAIAMLIAPAIGDGVMPITLPDQTDPLLRGTAARIYNVTSRQAHYLLSTVHTWDADPTMKLLTDSKSTEHWIRPNTSSVEGFAFLYRFGPYDDKVVGVTRQQLLSDTIIPMMRYLIATHVTGDRATSDGKKWGDMWQSAYWACGLGRAAWYAWDDLPDDLRAGVRRVVAHEADRFVNATPPHQVEDDTKAEENAWNSLILEAAALLMPDDTRRPQWDAAFQRWALSSFLRPSDEKSTTIVDGKPISEQFTGANIHDDYTLENHSIVHPDYMSCFTLTMDCVTDYVLTGRKPLDALSYNCEGIYANLKWFTLPDGGFIYPMGQDWHLFRNPDWLDAHLLMSVYKGDTDGWSLAMACLTATEKMQARSASGAVYVKGETFFASTEHGVFLSYTRMWLLLQVAKPITDRPKPILGVRYLKDAKIVLNRTPSAIHTCAWGSTIMAQCVPMGLDRIMSPDKSDGIGSIRLKDAKADLPVSLIEACETHGTDGFEVNLIIDHGKDVRADLRYKSNADGSLEVHEKLTAIKDVQLSQIATGLFGILNNSTWIYERGRRAIARDGVVTDVASCSGATVALKGATTIAVEGGLRFESREPLSARYIAATKLDRSRVTDLLYLNLIDTPTEWQAGEVISEYGVTISATTPTKAKDETIDMPTIIPYPASVEKTAGEFQLTERTAIYCDDNPEARAVARQLRDVLQGSGFVIGDQATTDAPTLPGAIYLTVKDADPTLGAEGYDLLVDAGMITVRALTPQGLFHGAQTIMQLLPPEFASWDITQGAKPWTVPGVHITDKPRYPWRGMLLDCCRHFMTKEFVKRYIDLLAYHKMNLLHWHLTEDQGWRIAINKYPKLTEIGAWRGEDRYGGFYTQDDVREIVAYAKSRYITVVPEIEMPGHSLAALAAYPELSCTGGPFKVGTEWGVYDDVYCAGSEKVFSFLQDVLTEVLDLFPSEFIHIGGDECPKTRWKTCPKCQDRIKAEGLADEHELQSYFIRRMEAFLNSKGRRLIGWDEILEGGLAPNATVQSWRGMDGAVAAATSGHDVISSPYSHCYLDLDTTLETTYSFEPTPPELTPDQAKHVLGVEGNMWTERCPQDRVDHMVFPRLSALAEVGWSPKEARNWSSFTQRMETHYLRLDGMGVMYGIPLPKCASKAIEGSDLVEVTLANPFGRGVIRYTVDGRDPTASSPQYTEPVRVSATATVKARVFLDSGNRSDPAEIKLGQ